MPKLETGIEGFSAVELQGELQRRGVDFRVNETGPETAWDFDIAVELKGLFGFTQRRAEVIQPLGARAVYFAPRPFEERLALAAGIHDGIGDADSTRSAEIFRTLLEGIGKTTGDYIGHVSLGVDQDDKSIFGTSEIRTTGRTSRQIAGQMLDFNRGIYLLRLFADDVIGGNLDATIGRR